MQVGRPECVCQVQPQQKHAAGVTGEPPCYCSLRLILCQCMLFSVCEINYLEIIVRTLKIARLD